VTKRIAVKCEFHEEETASCVLDFKTGRFYCFSCGTEGDFVIKYKTCEETLKGLEKDDDFPGIRMH
jgi:DNA primase